MGTRWSAKPSLEIWMSKWCGFVRMPRFIASGVAMGFDGLGQLLGEHTLFNIPRQQSIDVTTNHHMVTAGRAME